MLNSQKIQLRQSEVRQRLGEIAGLEGDDYSDEIKSEETKLQGELRESEQRLRTALTVEAAEDERAKREAEQRGDTQQDAEAREKAELRSKATLTGYMLAAAKGRAVTGAEAEFAAACNVSGIPLEIFEPTAEERKAEAERRAVTPAPGTVGVNLDPIRPAVFAQSVVPRLGVDMPRVPSGTFASGTVTTSAVPAAKNKGADIDATAGAITVSTATPKRISARLELAIEDIAAVGQANFESILRQNLSLALSDELDDQALNGDGQAPNLTGLFERLTNPNAPAAGVIAFDGFVGTFADGIDGLWATVAKDVAIVAGPDTYKLACKTFRDAAGQDLGDVSFADYAMQHYGGFWTSKRMPDKAAHIQQGILYRKGRSGMGASMGMRTAVCPHWGEVSIDDIYSGAKSGTRSFTMHVLLGDVILVQPDAYAQVAFRVSA